MRQYKLWNPDKMFGKRWIQNHTKTNVNPQPRLTPTMKWSKQYSRSGCFFRPPEMGITKNKNP